MLSYRVTSLVRARYASILAPTRLIEAAGGLAALRKIAPREVLVAGMCTYGWRRQWGAKIAGRGQGGGRTLGNRTLTVLARLLLKAFGFCELLALGLEVLRLALPEHGLLAQGRARECGAHPGALPVVMLLQEGADDSALACT